MAQPLISVIVPVYNGEAYIARLVDMLKKQIYQNLEIIIVNDGSADDTQTLCEAAAKQDARLHVFCKENGGASSARNYGLAKATGEYIGFVDADDYIYPEYFSYLYDLIQKYDADMACCGYYKMWPTEKTPKFGDNGTELVFSGHDALEHVWYRKYITVYPVLKLYRRSVLQDVLFSESIVYGEDLFFTLDAIERCKKVVYGGRVLYLYYQNSSSVTHNDQPTAYQTTWLALKIKLAQYTNTGSLDLANAAQSKCFVLALDCCRRFGKSKNQQTKLFVQELLTYIKNVSSGILKDQKCKPFNRFLAFLCRINAPMTVLLCRLYAQMKETLKIETRHSV